MTSSSQGHASRRYAFSSVIAVALLAGCAGTGELAKAVSYAGSASARTTGKADRAIDKAETAVAKNPQDASARAILANLYLQAGRFDSAATTFSDAMALGDSNPRTALSLALAHIGGGRNRDAVALLDQWRDSIPAGDLGLALALAGETSRGVAVLSDAPRGGDNTPKLRQNLAYAYALDGRWSEARVMAAQDVPADQLDTRISNWAMMGKPEDYQRRVAGLLGTPVVTDPGQPSQLALGGAPSFGPASAEAAQVLLPRVAVNSRLSTARRPMSMSRRSARQPMKKPPMSCRYRSTMVTARRHRGSRRHSAMHRQRRIRPSSCRSRSCRTFRTSPATATGGQPSARFRALSPASARLRHQFARQSWQRRIAPTWSSLGRSRARRMRAGHGISIVHAIPN